MVSGVALMLHGHLCDVFFLQPVSGHIAIHFNRKNPQQIGLERAFGGVLEHVRRERGLDCSQYKESFLRRRLAVRMRAREVS